MNDNPTNAKAGERLPMVRDELAILIGLKARAARERARLTQADVAEQVDLASEVYGRLERGLMRPSVETLKNLCDVLGISADEALGVQRERPGTIREVLPPVGDSVLRRLVRRARELPPGRVRLLAILAKALAPSPVPERKP